MKAPIIVSDPGDISIFESLQRAERYVEPVDVKNDEFVYFDSEGKILQAIVVRDSKGIEQTKITDCDEEKFNELELKRLLKNFLAHLNYPKFEIENMELFQLVRETLKFETK